MNPEGVSKWRRTLPEGVEALRDDEDLEVCLRSSGYVVTGRFVNELEGGGGEGD